MPRKPSSPWKLVYSTAGGPIEEKYRSKPALYRAAEAERARIANGTSRVVRMSAYQWNVDCGDWVLYERLPIDTSKEQP